MAEILKGVSTGGELGVYGSGWSRDEPFGWPEAGPPPPLGDRKKDRDLHQGFPVECTHSKGFNIVRR